MKTTRNRILLIGLISCMLATLTWKSYGNHEPTQTGVQKWEYSGMEVPMSEFGAREEKKLTSYGESGWELVGFTNEPRLKKIGRDTKTTEVHIFFFKRPKS